MRFIAGKLTFMNKNIIAFLILSIGIYTTLRYNVVRFPDGQILWSATTELFDKIFLPGVMVFSSICSLILRKSRLWYATALVSMYCDFLLRVKETVNLAYLNFVLSKEGSHGFIFPSHPDILSHWPSFIMCLIELVLIVFLIKHLVKNYKLERNS